MPWPKCCAACRNWPESEPVHIERIGSGTPLVLIHGWAMHSGLFAPLTQALQRHFCVYLVDLPGHGRSRTDTELSFEHVLPMLFEQVPDGAIWAGWSLGGLFALKAVERHPERIGGLIGIATTPCFVKSTDWAHGVPFEVFSGFAQGLRENFERTVQRFLALEAMGSAQATALLRSLHEEVMAFGAPDLEALQHGLTLLEYSDARPIVQGLKAPSLWIAGRRDRLVPAAALHWCAQATPQGRLLELDSGHMPFLGHADTMATAILATFVNR